jgi:hypothetical protein
MAKQRKGISKALAKGKVESSFKIDESADDSGFGSPKPRDLPSEPIPTNPQLKRVGPDAATKEQMSKLGETIGKDKKRIYTFGRTDREAQALNLVNPDVKVVRNEKGKKVLRLMEQKEKPFTNFFKDPVTGAENYSGYYSGELTSSQPYTYDEERIERARNANPLLQGQQKPNPNNLLNAEAATVSPTQGQSLVAAINPTPEAKVEAAMQNDNTGAVLSNAILKDGTQSAETANQVFEAPQVAKEAQKEADKQVSALDDVTAKVFTAPYGSFDEEGDASSMGTGAVQGETTQTQIQKGPVPGSGEAITTVVGSTEQTRPAFDQIATKDQIMNDIAGQYIKGQENVPYAVVEKLGIQDYYPNVGRDIAVGTFSGSRIGSQTIYSGAGALLPMGLYDARKRALKDAAKTKQAEIDKILTVPDTTPQLKEAFYAYALKRKYEDLARNNFDPALYSRDLEARKNDIMLEATAKNLTYATQMAQKLLDGTIPKDGKPGNYMPEEQKKILRELLTGTMEDPEAFFSGKKNVNDYYKNVRQFADGTVLVNDMIKQWTTNPVELPVNLKTGAALSEADVANINAATDQYLKSVNDGNPDTESYMTMIKKYYELIQR